MCFRHRLALASQASSIDSLDSRIWHTANSELSFDVRETESADRNDCGSQGSIDVAEYDQMKVPRLPIYPTTRLTISTSTSQDLASIIASAQQHDDRDDQDDVPKGSSRVETGIHQSSAQDYTAPSTDGITMTTTPQSNMLHDHDLELGNLAQRQTSPACAAHSIMSYDDDNLHKKVNYWRFDARAGIPRMIVATVLCLLVLIGAIVAMWKFVAGTSNLVSDANRIRILSTISPVAQ